MSEKKKKPEKEGNSMNLTQIIVASIGGMGVLGAALFANWDKIIDQRGNRPPVVEPNNRSNEDEPNENILQDNSISSNISSIISPKHMERVARNITVKGNFKNIKKGWTIWLYVYTSDENKYYPHEVKNLHNDGSWWIDGVIIGALNENSDHAFHLGLIILNEIESNKLREDSKALEYGLDKLPGKIITKQISVFRK